MKVLLQLLLAAPAVMGRACRARPRTTTTFSRVAISTTAVHVSTYLPEPTEVVAPIISKGEPDDKASAIESIVVPSSVPEVATTLATSVAPAATSASSGSGSGSGSTSGSTELDGRVITGSSTWYGGNLSGGTCSFTTYSLPAGIYGTAFSGQVWNGAANCGSCIEVTGPKGTIKAMVVDQCPECNEGHLDFFPDAFTAVGGTDGIVNTSYKFVTCGITSPIKLHNKTGTSQWWFSMQVVNANEPVKSLEVSVDGGKTWKKTVRKDYNFFEEQSGFGTQSVDVKVTSTTGKTITVKNISVASDSEHSGGSNF